MTNTGKVPGKTPVQITARLPTSLGGVERLLFSCSTLTSPACWLRRVRDRARQRSICSTSPATMESYENADGTTGAYIMDPGSYLLCCRQRRTRCSEQHHGCPGHGCRRWSAPATLPGLCEGRSPRDFISRTLFSVSKDRLQDLQPAALALAGTTAPARRGHLTRTDWAGPLPQALRRHDRHQRTAHQEPEWVGLHPQDRRRYL